MEYVKLSYCSKHLKHFFYTVLLCQILYNLLIDLVKVYSFFHLLFTCFKLDGSFNFLDLLLDSYDNFVCIMLAFLNLPDIFFIL